MPQSPHPSFSLLIEADKLCLKAIQLGCHLERPELRAVLCTSVGHQETKGCRQPWWNTTPKCRMGMVGLARFLFELEGKLGGCRGQHKEHSCWWRRTGLSQEHRSRCPAQLAVSCTITARATGLCQECHLWLQSQQCTELGAECRAP